MNKTGQLERIVLPAWEMLSSDPEMWETRPREGWKYCIIFDAMQGWVSYFTEGTKYKRCTKLYDKAAVSMDEAKSVCLRHWQNNTSAPHINIIKL